MRQMTAQFTNRLEQVKEPVDTEDDKPFSREEIAFVIKILTLKRLLGRFD